MLIIRITSTFTFEDMEVWLSRTNSADFRTETTLKSRQVLAGRHSTHPARLTGGNVSVLSYENTK